MTLSFFFSPNITYTCYIAALYTYINTNKPRTSERLPEDQDRQNDRLSGGRYRITKLRESV